LLKRTQEFLRERTGGDVWSSLKHRAEIVISHPNRWGTKQQKFLEEAAIQAGLVTREGAKKYLHFVEEAEAAASFALALALTRDITLDLKFEVCEYLHNPSALLRNKKSPALEWYQVCRMRCWWLNC
jgi:hypothetical protein